ncbi:MAG: HypC/HybG/HupF family hydrogenase formation chaperone [Syntrophomonadaceae bacterium]|nr:HypC/HybG/HupF family hydrogenase formation chaperone [Syntrophomonadaceae bacterium]
MCLAVPGKIIAVKERQIATVDVNGNQTEISIRLTPEAKQGEYVLIHAGFAIEIVDEDAARETMRYLLEIMQYEDEKQ